MSTIAHPYIASYKFIEADPRLSPTAKRLLALLDDYRNKITGQCNPRIMRLARDLARSRRTIQRALSELCWWGLIQIHHGQTVSQYFVAARETWGKLLAQMRIKFGTRPVEKPGSRPTEKKRTEGEDPTLFSADSSAPEWHSAQRQNGTVEPPHLLLNLPIEPTYKESGDADAARSVDLAQEKTAAATPAAVENSVSQNRELAPCGRPKTSALRSPFSEQLWLDLSAVHPQPGQSMRALAEIDQLLAENWQQAAAMATAIRNRHAQWCEYWATLEKGGFIPQLWRWVKEGEWIMPPVTRTPARRAFESRAERVERIAKACIERAERIDKEKAS